VVRSGTGNATLQKGELISRSSVSAQGNGKENVEEIQRAGHEMKLLPADKKNAHENRNDSGPLPARNVFSQENGRETDGDRPVK
jgi:hypothetical protein